MKTTTPTLYDFVMTDVPYLHRDLSPATQRKLVTSIRGLWTFMERPPDFADLQEPTFRAFGEHLKRAGKALETVNDNLRYAWEVAVLAHKAGYLPDEPPYLQLTPDGKIEIRPRATRRPAQFANGGGWDLPDLVKLFEILGAATGNLGSVPSSQWWTTLALFIADTGSQLRESLALVWSDVDLEAGLVHVAGKPRRLREGTKAALEALNTHRQPAVFPPPSEARTAIQLLYRRLKAMLIEGGLQKRTMQPLDRLAKADLPDASLDLLASLVVIKPPRCPDAAPPLLPGPRRHGRKVFHQPDVLETVPVAELSRDMTLRDFFAGWFQVVVLATKEATAATLSSYTESLDWWEIITENPPFSAMGDVDALWARFEAGLKDARYLRGQFAGERPLASATQAHHKQNLRALFRRAAEKRLCTMPVIVVPRGKFERKGSFTLWEARQMCQALRVAPSPAGAAPPRELRPRRAAEPLRMTSDWWLAIVAAMFYTGLRTSEIFSLRWGMLSTREGLDWLDVPGEAVPKTGKPILIGLHACLREALAAIGPGEPGELIFFWPGAYTNFLACHRQLQRRAGIPEERIQSPHAWRRTYADQLGETLFQDATEAVQRALSHESSETTEKHYLSDGLKALATRSLARLWEPA